MTQRRFGAGLALLAALVAAGLGPAGRSADAHPEPRAGVWLAGDLHVHTTYSHDSYGGPGDDNTEADEAHTLGHSVEDQFRLAALRGLDYLAITDHNDVRSQADPGWEAGGVVGLPAYENSLRGHAQMLGATRIYERDKDDAPAVNTMADALRADGGLFQINHPAGETVHGGDLSDFGELDWGYGFDVAPDAVEVWNIHPAWQPPLPSSNSIDLAIAYWEAWLDRGHRVAATGGSDNHWVSTTAVQGVGQPTTWVFARKPTREGILEAMREGRTFVSHQPPAHHGPQAFLEADRHRDGTFEAIVGDEVPGHARLRVRVIGAPGSILRVFTAAGHAEHEVPVATPTFTYEFDAPEGARWVRAEVAEPDAAEARQATCHELVKDGTTLCYDRLNLLVLTSPIYIGTGG